MVDPVDEEDGIPTTPATSTERSALYKAGVGPLTLLDDGPRMTEKGGAMRKSSSLRRVAAVGLVAVAMVFATGATSHAHGGSGGGHGSSGGHSGGGHSGYHGHSHGHHGGHGRAFIGVGPSFWWGYPYWRTYPYGWSYPYGWGYPYGGNYPTEYVSQPPVNAPPAQSYWYYCQSAGTYYPYVSSCPETWIRVPATPPQ